MNHSYSDIRSRIAEAPIWFDEHAVPRYEPFAIDGLSNIYAIEACLVGIACQGCDARFLVAFSWSWMDYDRDGPWSGGPWHRWHTPAHVKDLHYGDPPNVECC